MADSVDMVDDLLYGTEIHITVYQGKFHDIPLI